MRRCSSRGRKAHGFQCVLIHFKCKSSQLYIAEVLQFTLPVPKQQLFSDWVRLVLSTYFMRLWGNSSANASSLPPPPTSLPMAPSYRETPQGSQNRDELWQNKTKTPPSYLSRGTFSKHKTFEIRTVDWSNATLRSEIACSLLALTFSWGGKSSWGKKKKKQGIMKRRPLLLLKRRWESIPVTEQVLCLSAVRFLVLSSAVGAVVRKWLQPFLLCHSLWEPCGSLPPVSVGFVLIEVLIFKAVAGSPSLNRLLPLVSKTRIS